MQVSRRPVVSVFAVSLASLSFEVLINRAFSITQWMYLAFFVISIAMFGYSAGSVWIHRRVTGRPVRRAAGRPARRPARRLSGRPARRPARRATRRPGPEAAAVDAAVPVSRDGDLLPTLVLVAGAAMLGSWLLQLIIPFDAVRLPFSVPQAAYLAAVFLLLALPFFFAGAVTAVAFAVSGVRPGYIYAASMAGSAAGALLPALLLPFAGFSGCLLLSVAIALAPALSRGRPAVRIAAAACIAGCAALYFGGAAIDPAPSSYKALAQYMEHPDAEITSTRESIDGRLDAYRGAGFHAAPGLSLSYRGPIPEQTALFVDGGAPTVLYAGSTPGDYQFALASVGALAFALVPSPENVLVVLSSGGAGIAAAVAAGAVRIDVADHLTYRGDAVEAHYGGFGVTAYGGPIRRSVETLNREYDLILIEHPGSSTPAMTSINEDYALTAEGIAALLGKLSHDGILSINRRLQVPPADMLKVLGAVYMALEKSGVPAPETHLAVIRNYNTYSLVVGLKPFAGTTAVRATAISEFCTVYGFDPVYFSGIDSQEVNINNRRPVPIYYTAVTTLLSDLASDSNAFQAEYYLNIRVPTDDRPYLDRILKWGKLRELYGVTGARQYPFYFSGEIVIVLVFAIALVFSLVIILLPAIRASRGAAASAAGSAAASGKADGAAGAAGGGAPDTRAPRSLDRLARSLIFCLAGAGYMLFEIAWIKRLVPVVGSHSWSFAVVLAAVLISSGAGGYLSVKIPYRRAAAVLLLPAVTVLLSLFGMRVLLPGISGVGGWIRWPVIIILVAAPGLPLGMPISLTMRYVCRSPSDRVFGWALNGAISVLSSVGAAGLALYTGIQSLLWFAAASYALLWALFSLQTSWQSHRVQSTGTQPA